MIVDILVDISQGENEQRKSVTTRIGYLKQQKHTTVRVTKNLMTAMPAWLQLGHQNTVPVNPQARCLIDAHNTKSVKNLCKTTERLRRVYRGGVHTPVFSCHCDDCSEDRAKGCTNPQNALFTHNADWKIVPKLNPTIPTHNDNLSFTERRKSSNRVLRTENTGIIFDPSITQKSNLADCFRIFTNRDNISTIQA